jgi:hypothetical protein
VNHSVLRITSRRRKTAHGFDSQHSIFARCDYQRILQFFESIRPFELSCIFQNAGARYDDVGHHNGRGEQGAGRKKPPLIF